MNQFTQNFTGGGGVSENEEEKLSIFGQEVAKMGQDMENRWTLTNSNNYNASLQEGIKPWVPSYFKDNERQFNERDFSNEMPKMEGNNAQHKFNRNSWPISTQNSEDLLINSQIWLDPVLEDSPFSKPSRQF